MELSGFSSDVLLHIFSYICIVDAIPSMEVCQRFFYLIEYLHKELLDSELTASSTSDINNKNKTTNNLLHKEKKKKSIVFDIYSQVLRHALSHLRCKPNIAFSFVSTSDIDILTSSSRCVGNRVESLKNAFDSCLPRDTPVLCVMSNIGIESLTSSQTGASSSSSTTAKEDITQSTFAAYLGKFQNCDILEFAPAPWQLNTILDDTNDMRDLLFPDHDDIDTSLPTDDPSNNFQFFFVFACGPVENCTSKFVSKLQAQYPNATIVGGICTSGLIRISKSFKSLEKKFERMTFRQTKSFVKDFFYPSAEETVILLEKNDKQSLIQKVKELYYNKNETQSEIQHIEDGVFGFGIRGNNGNVDDIPVKAIVSRGVKSLTNLNRASSFSSEINNYMIHKMETLLPHHEGYPYEGGNDLQPIKLICSIKNITTNEIITPFQLLRQADLSRVEFVGFKTSNSNEGYYLHSMQRNMIFEEYLVIEDSSFSNNMTLVGEEETTPVFIDYFELNKVACVEDLTTTLHKVRDIFNNNSSSSQQHHNNTTNPQEEVEATLLGAIMISCFARSDFLDKEDASTFSSIFPNIPCLGFYAGGEIGPRPYVLGSGTFNSRGPNNNNIFRKGNVTVQGYTAIFVMIIANKNCNKRDNIIRNDVDDNEENVKEYVKDRLAKIND